MKKYESTKLTLQEYGLKLLTLEEDFKGINESSIIECSMGHIWNGKISNILDKKRIQRSSKGCPDCANEIRFAHSYSLAQSQIPEGYELLSVYSKLVSRKKLSSVLTFILKCPNNHEYEKEAGRLLHSECPQCTAKTFVGQERVRAIFETFFQYPFISIRPDWLINPATGRALELDGYCEELKIAFEYQGRQHFSNDTEFGGDYAQQAERDEFKKLQCEKKGIKLIWIHQPRSYVEEKFIASVLKDCKEQNLEIPFFESLKISFSHINDKNSVAQKYKDFKNFVENKNYTLISNGLNSLEDKLEFQCTHGHEFTMTALNFKSIYARNQYRAEACIECYQQKNPHKVKELINLQSCHELAEKIGFKCLSTQYTNIHGALEWKCLHDHTVIKSYRQMIRNQTGQYCSECEKLGLSHPAPIQTLLKPKNRTSKTLTGEVRDKAWLENFLSENQCTLLESDYMGMDIKHGIECQNKHQFFSTLSNLMDKKKRGTPFCTDCSSVNVIDLKTCQDFAQKNGLICLSSDYRNVNEKMDWQCEKGHFFSKGFRQFLRSKTGKYCPECS